MYSYSFFTRTYLPYCIQRQESGEYIILNRYYKPVGINTKPAGLGTPEDIKCEDFPVSAPFKITKATAKKLSWEGSENVDKICLYINAYAPDRGKKYMDAYLIKLQLLMKLKLKTDRGIPPIPRK